MKQRLTKEQLVFAWLKSGTPVVDVCRQIACPKRQIAPGLKKYGDMVVTEVRRLKMLEARLVS